MPELGRRGGSNRRLPHPKSASFTEDFRSVVRTGNGV